MEARPATGRDLARIRLTLGLSLSQVAAQLHTTHHTIQRWEANTGPVDPERALRWETALATLARERSVTLSKQGFGIRDLPRDLRRALHQLELVPGVEQR
jgi:transcriptional regulator with XRE-family HTH domain